MAVVSTLICYHFMLHDIARISSRVTDFTLNPKRLAIWNSYLQFVITTFSALSSSDFPQNSLSYYITMCIPFMYFPLYSLCINCLSRHFAREARMFGGTRTSLNVGKKGAAVPHIRRSTRNSAHKSQWNSR